MFNEAYLYSNRTRLWKCYEYKSPTKPQRYGSFFKEKDGVFIKDYQSDHLGHKYYTIEIERDKRRKYLKELVQKSPNKYAVQPKDIYLKTKQEYPQFKIPYNKYKQLNTNYLEAEKAQNQIQ